jgi:hypothetical protein
MGSCGCRPSFQPNDASTVDLVSVSLDNDDDNDDENRLVKDFSLEEEIHMLFAQRLESGPRNCIPSSGQPT